MAVTGPPDRGPSHAAGSELTASVVGYLLSGGTTQGYAIPINRAKTVVKVGAFPGRYFTGAIEEEVSSGTTAQSAGLAADDVTLPDPSARS